MQSWKIHNAEVCEWAAEEAARIAFGDSLPYHAILSDPPYGLEFMGAEWDSPSVACSFPKAGNLGGFANGNKPSFARQGDIGEKFERLAQMWGKALKPLLYPGALVFIFAGTRMWHRLACGMEDAGFRLWDTLLWIHGQGFPKGQAIDAMIDQSLGMKDQRKQIGTKEAGIGTGRHHGHHQRENGGPESRIIPVTATATATATAEGLPWRGHKTAALKPSWEPVLCFRAPDENKTYAELALEYGSGALNVDGGRIGVSKRIPGSTSGKANGAAWNKPEARPEDDGQNPNIGRYPANLALECICERTELVDAPVCGDVSGEEPTSINRPTGTCYGQYDGREPFRAYRGKAIRHTDPNCPAFQLDEQAGEVGGGFATRGASTQIYGGGKGFTGATGETVGLGDSGGPSRFFYCAKASRGEREAGLEVFPRGCAHPLEDAERSTRAARRCKICGLLSFGRPYCMCENPQWEETEGSRVANTHPTVKSIDLNRWLATLLLPPDSVKPRRILVPFAGVGSEMVGCLLAGWDEVVGVEMDENFCRIGNARIAHWLQDREACGELRASEVAPIVTKVVPAQASLF